ncbi:MAG: hypothetical protein AAF665_09505 [Pseudomonadota bacterium]
MSEGLLPFGLGTMQIPGAWEARSQITLLEPESTLDADLKPTVSASRPRTNFVISRAASDGKDRYEARQEFLMNGAQAIPQFKILSDEDLFFDDGVEGASVKLTFPATPVVQLVQQHVFRIDADLLTQIVVTVDTHRARELEDNLLAVLKTYTV